MSNFDHGWLPVIRQSLRKFFASAAQGAKADSSLQPGSIGTSVQAYNAGLAALAALPGTGLIQKNGATDFSTVSLEASNALSANIAQGRLSLADGDPTPAGEQLAKTAIYYTPFEGNLVSLFNATTSNWETHQFPQLTLDLAGLSANTNFDVFIYLDGGSPALERVAWNNSTAGISARAESIIRKDGIYVKDSSQDRRLLGTFRTTGVVGQCEVSKAKLLLRNIENRVPWLMLKEASSTSWVPTDTNWNPLDSDTSNRLELIFPVIEDLQAEAKVGIANFSNNPAQYNIGIHINKATGVVETTDHSGFNGEWFGSAFVNAIISALFLEKEVPAGYNFLQVMERCTVANNGNVSFDAGIGAGRTSGVAATVLY
ncbi:MAG: hypothetical protein F6K42_15465 [Leptolyngbya sp. SIO1D8]|nr:hypothetical protein [Leptolyngbya sp. SIO1D8]